MRASFIRNGKIVFHHPPVSLPDREVRMPNTLMQNFQARVADVIDEYLLLGAKPEDIRAVLQQEDNSDLAMRAKELGADER